MNWPKISVVVPSFNQAQYLPQCLDSILAQEYPNLELIVLDGGSTDGSREVLQRYRQRFAYWQSQPDGGHMAALNKGLFEIATGEVLTWLSSDDWWAPGVLREAATAISPRDGRWLVAGRAKWVIEPGGQEHDHPFSGSRTHRQLVEFWKHGTIPQPSVFFHRAVAAEAGRLSLQEKLAFDYDYWLRLTRLPGVDLFFVDRVWSYYRLHEGAKSVASHYQSHLDLERVSRQYWTSRWRTGIAYWLSRDPHKPQQQHYQKVVRPALKKARLPEAVKHYAWIATHCPANLWSSGRGQSERMPEFPLLGWFSDFKEFRRQVALALKKQRGPLLHPVSGNSFNLHPPVRLVVRSRVLRRQPLLVRFKARVPDARACGVTVRCWLEDHAGRPVGAQEWTIAAGAARQCVARWQTDNNTCRQLVLESRVADGYSSNAFGSTIISDLSLKTP